MPAGERIDVVPGVLTWARRSAGFADAAIAAKKIGISEATLGRWESGELSPTIRQLRKAAKVYRRPLAVMLLLEPPRDFDAVRDFRRMPASGQSHDWSPALRAEFRRAVSQRDVLLELSELAPGSIQVEAEIPRITPTAPAEEVADVLRDALDVAPAQSWARSYDALNDFISAVEGLGVVVMQTRDVSVNEMRGFSLSEHPFSVIALNGSDWPRPRLFTLLHELTHVTVNAAGLCDLHETQRVASSAEDRIEHFCNEVAAAILMPTSAVSDSVGTVEPGYAWTLEELERLSKQFGASRESVLLRLVSLGLATWDLYWTRKGQLDREYEEMRLEEAVRRRERGGGPNYYVVKARDLGHGYVATVLDAFRSHAISSLDVADYLEVRFEQLPKLESALR